MTKYWIYIVGALVGGVLGWMYWNYVGCDESCAIWSNPRNSTAYGVLLGAVAFGSFKDLIRRKEK